MLFDDLLDLINFAIILWMAKLSNVTIKFHDKIFLNNFTFDFGEGFCAVFGESGSGKTVISYVFAGLVTIERGEVYLGGNEVGNIAPKHRKVSLISAQTIFKNGSVRNNVLFPLKLRKTKKIDTIDTNLPSDLLDKNIDELTSVEKARVYFARAMIKSPSLVIVDEASEILDYEGVPELMHLTSESGINVLWLTSDFEQIKSFDGDIAIIRRGNVWASGGACKLKSNPPDSYVASLYGYNILQGRAVPTTAFFKGKKEIIVRVNFVDKVDDGYMLHCHYDGLPIKIFSKREFSGEFAVTYDESMTTEIC